MNVIVWFVNAVCEWFKSLGSVDKCDCKDCDYKLEPSYYIELTCLCKFDRRNLSRLCERQNMPLKKNHKGKLCINLEQIFWLKKLMDAGKIKGVKQRESIKLLLKKADRRA